MAALAAPITSKRCRSVLAERATRRGAVEIVKDTDLDRAWSIGLAFPDQRFSIVDRSSFAVMERLGISRVASFDDDFVVYRYGRRRELSFEVLR